MNEAFKPPDGYNPMNWDCERSGCFNRKLRPKIETFADCFPRKIGFGDIDAIVELNNAFIILEWKADGGALPQGQELMLTRFSKLPNCLAVIVHGNPETMVVDGYSTCWDGKHGKHQTASLDDLKKLIQRWVRHVEGFC